MYKRRRLRFELPFEKWKVEKPGKLGVGLSGYTALLYSFNLRRAVRPARGQMD